MEPPIEMESDVSLVIIMIRFRTGIFIVIGYFLWDIRSHLNVHRDLCFTVIAQLQRGWRKMILMFAVFLLTMLQQRWYIWTPPCLLQRSRTRDAWIKIQDAIHSEMDGFVDRLCNVVCTETKRHIQLEHHWQTSSGISPCPCPSQQRPLWGDDHQAGQDTQERS